MGCNLMPWRGGHRTRRPILRRRPPQPAVVQAQQPQAGGRPFQPLPPGAPLPSGAPQARALACHPSSPQDAPLLVRITGLRLAACALSGATRPRHLPNLRGRTPPSAFSSPHQVRLAALARSPIPGERPLGGEVWRGLRWNPGRVPRRSVVHQPQPSSLNPTRSNEIMCRGARGRSDRRDHRSPVTHRVKGRDYCRRGVRAPPGRIRVAGLYSLVLRACFGSGGRRDGAMRRRLLRWR